MVNLILASVDINGKHIIGDGNKLPWRIKEELQFFKNTTQYSTVIMGYNTAKSLNYKPLPTRLNVVVCDVGRVRSSNPEDPLWNSGMTIVDFSGLESVIKKHNANAYIIGGAKLYSLVLERYCHLIDGVFWSKINPELVDPNSWSDPIEFTDGMYEKMKTFMFHEHYRELNNKFIVMKGVKNEQV